MEYLKFGIFMIVVSLATAIIVRAVWLFGYYHGLLISN